jgi:hypothetical protein
MERSDIRDRRSRISAGAGSRTGARRPVTAGSSVGIEGRAVGAARGGVSAAINSGSDLVAHALSRLKDLMVSAVRRQRTCPLAASTSA